MSLMNLQPNDIHPDADIFLWNQMQRPSTIRHSKLADHVKVKPTDNALNLAKKQPNFLEIILKRLDKTLFNKKVFGNQQNMKIMWCKCPLYCRLNLLPKELDYSGFFGALCTLVFGPLALKIWWVFWDIMVI